MLLLRVWDFILLCTVRKIFVYKSVTARSILTAYLILHSIFISPLVTFPMYFSIVDRTEAVNFALFRSSTHAYVGYC